MFQKAGKTAAVLHCKESLGSGLWSLDSNLCELDTKWQEATEVLLNRLKKGIDVAFITIGDPTIYSTFFYIYNHLIKLAPELKIVLIPGVSSINASAAAAKVSLSLADEKIAILPATYAENINDILERFRTCR